MTTKNSAQSPITMNVTTPLELSGYYLEAAGWKKKGVHIPEGTQSVIATYIKGDDKITYDGVSWFLNDFRKLKDTHDL